MIAVDRGRMTVRLESGVEVTAMRARELGRHGVVVEIDGQGNHHTPAQRDRDRRKDLAFRQVGLVVNGYSTEQLEASAQAVTADVLATLEARSAA